MPLPTPCQPHEPQFVLEQPAQFEPPPAPPDMPESPPLLWAKTDICFCSSSLPHCGQLGLSDPMTRVSNSLPQERQTKSYSGIFSSPGSNTKTAHPAIAPPPQLRQRLIIYRQYRPSRSIAPLGGNRQVLHLFSFYPKVERLSPPQQVRGGSFFVSIRCPAGKCCQEAYGRVDQGMGPPHCYQTNGEEKTRQGFLPAAY